MANFFYPAVIEIKAVADQAIAKFKDVNGELDKMEGYAGKAGAKISYMDKASRLASASLVGMAAAFGAFATIGVKEASATEQAVTKLGTSLMAVGIDANKALPSILDYADGFAALGFGGDEALAGLSRLIPVTRDLATAQTYLGIATDYARDRNMTLEQASTIIARAAAGNTKVFTQYGITVAKTGDKATNTKIAMEQLAAVLGGKASAYANTFEGQMKVLSETFKNTAESVGVVLLPILVDFMGKIKSTFDWIKANSKAVAIWTSVIVALTISIASYNAAIKVASVLTAIWTTATTLAYAAQVGLTTGVWSLNAALAANPIGLVVAGIVAFISVLFIAWNASAKFRSAVVSVFKAIVSLIQVTMQAFAKLQSVLGKLPGAMGAPFRAASKSMEEGAKSLDKFKAKLDGLKDKKLDLKSLIKTPEFDFKMPKNLFDPASIEGAAKETVNKLKEAFAKASKVDVGELFKDMLGVSTAKIGKTTGDIATTVSVWGSKFESGINGMLQAMRDRLKKAQELSRMIARLLAEGFSRTFVTQITEQGVDVGTQIAKTLLGGTTAQRAEIMSLFKQTQDTTALLKEGRGNNYTANVKVETNASPSLIGRETLTAFKYGIPQGTR